MRSQDDADRRGSRSLITPRQDVMSSARVEFTLDQPSFQQLLLEPTLCTVEQIRRALDQGNYDDAAIRALARLDMRLEVPPDVLVDVLVGLETKNSLVFIALAKQVPTEVLLDRLRRGHFGDDVYDVDRVALVATVAWLARSTDETRAQLVPLLRRAARWPHLPLEARAFLRWLVVEFDDVHLRELFQSRHGADKAALARLLGDQVRAIWRAPLDQIVAALPQETNDPLMRAWSEKARTPKVGPNERCPCGSGKKYKKCHSGRAEELKPVRPSRVEVFRAFSSWVGPEFVRRMPRASLAALDVRLLKPTTLRVVLTAFAYARDWPRAQRARDEIARRVGGAEADKYWCPVVYEAIRARQFDVARELFSELQNPSGAKDLEFELELHDLCERHREGFGRLERAAETAVRGGIPGAGALARAVLHTMPALGILVARGAHPEICDADPDELTGLLNEIEDARNTLGLSPHDPAWDLYGLSDGGEDEDQGSEDTERDDRDRDRVAADLQAKLGETTRRMNELERQLAEQAREMAVERPVAP